MKLLTYTASAAAFSSVALAAPTPAFLPRLHSRPGLTQTTAGTHNASTTPTAFATSIRSSKASASATPLASATNSTTTTQQRDDPVTPRPSGPHSKATFIKWVMNQHPYSNDVAAHPTDSDTFVAWVHNIAAHLDELPLNMRAPHRDASDPLNKSIAELAQSVVESTGNSRNNTEVAHKRDNSHRRVTCTDYNPHDDTRLTVTFDYPEHEHTPEWKKFDEWYGEEEWDNPTYPLPCDELDLDALADWARDMVKFADELPHDH